MENTPPYADPPPAAYRSCPRCHTPNPDWVIHCARCGAELPLPETAAQSEIAHIEYVLWQLPWWLSRNLLSAGSAAKLQDEYEDRQNRLQSWIAGRRLPVTEEPTIPVVPPLPVQTVPPSGLEPADENRAPEFWDSPAMSRPGLSRNVSPEAPSLPNAHDRPVPERQPNAARGIAVFLQEHALKIVFALATVLVLIALRSILGWNATNRAFLALTPLLPLGLTAMFWQFGRRTQQENPWAAFVYQSLTAVLLGFDLFILNRFWLTPINLGMPSRLVLLTACCISTPAFALSWRQHRYPPMWHLVQGGILITLFAALQGFKQLLWQQVDWRPAPLLLFGLAYVGAAAVYFGIAVRNPERSVVDGAEPATVSRQAWILWANLSVALAFVLSALALAFSKGLRSDDFLLVLLLAGTLYGIIAQALDNARLVYIAAFLCLGTGIAWVPAHLHLGALSYAVLLISVSAIALALQTYNRSMPSRRSLAIAWRHVALATNTLALVLIGGQTLLVLFGASSPEASPATLLCAGLALACSLQFAFTALSEAEALLCYPACVSVGIALLSLLQFLHTDFDRYPVALAAYAALLLLLSLRRNVPQRAQNAGADPAPAWHDIVRTSGKMTLGLSMAAGSLLAGVHGHSVWLVASLLLNGVLCAAIGSHERSPGWAYAALYGAAYAFGLFTHVVAPVPLTFTDCMLPFVLLCAVGALVASLPRSARNGESTGTIPPLTDVWRDPLADAGLLSLAITLFAAWSQIQLIVSQPHLALDTVVCIAAALLLTATRRVGTVDGRRAGALVLLNAATALGIAEFTGLAPVGHTVPSAAWHAFVCGLLIQSWAYWLIARAMYLFSASEVWSEELSYIEMGLVGLSALLTTLAAVGTDAPSASMAAQPLFLIGGAFLLVHLEMLRARKDTFLILSLGILLLAGITALSGHAGNQSYPALTSAAFPILATASYLQLARILKNTWIAGLTGLPLLGGATVSLVQFGILPLNPHDSMWANSVWVVGGLAVAWSYLGAARWSNQSAFVYASGITLICAYLRMVTWAVHLPNAWDALLLLPLLFGMGALALRTPRGWELVQKPYLEVAAAASGLALTWSAINGEGWLGLARDHTPYLTAITLSAYGVAYLALAIVRKTPTPLATGAALLTLAYLHLLLGKTSLLSTEHPTLSWPLFAFLSLQAALVWTGAGAILKRLSRYPALATPLLSLAQIVALVSAVFAVWSLYSPQQADLGILTLVSAAAIWFCHWTLDQGEICLHVGTGNLMVAWCVIIFRTMGAEIHLLDVYLLPFGLYLLLLGHLISRRQKQQEAQTFWGVGLLVTLTPALLTRWEHAPGWHAALLMAECVVCVLWGISQRIRVFVAAGLGTIVLYAASVLIGTLPDTVTTILALLTGVGLFVFGFYALTHREMMKQLANNIQQRWTIWHSWR